MMFDVAPLLLGALLGWTGASKVFGRSTREQAARTVLVRVLGDVDRASLALRAVGVVEVALALGLIASPAWWVPGGGAVLLGCGFLAYLTYARITAPTSSCGCTQNDQAPITWRAFARAGLVITAAVGGLKASGPWWATLAASPLETLGLVLIGAIVVAGLSTDLDHLWLLPLRRLRLRLFGHPLSEPDDGPPPLEATTELLDRSAAWETMAPVVRSGLLEHWDADGWRLLRFAGAYDGKPVSVVFALDVNATVDTTPNPAIRVTVVDDTTGTPIEFRPPVPAS